MSKKDETSKQLGTPFLYFLSGNIFTLIVGFSLQVYVANELGAGKLGVFSLLDAGVGLIIGLLSFGIAPTLVKFIPQHLANKEYRCIKTLIRWGLFLLIAIGIGAYGLILLLLPKIIDYWPVLINYHWAVLIMLLMIPIGLISFFFQQCLRGFQEFRHMVFASVYLQLTLKVFLVIIFFSIGMQLMGYILSVVLSTFFALLWMAYGLNKKTRKLNVSNFEEPHHAIGIWGNYAKIMYSTNLIGNSVSYLDRFILAYFGSAIEVGVLAVVKQLNQMPMVFMQLLLTVAAPMFSEANALSDHNKILHIYHLITDWVTRIAFPLFVFLIVFSEKILSIFGSEFSELGTSSLIILILGQFINVIYGPIGILMNMTGHEKVLLKLTFYQSIIMLIGMTVLVPYWGLIGVAVSITVTNIALNIFCFRVAKRKIGIKWRDARYSRWILPMLVCGGCAIIIRNLFIDYSSVYLLFFLIALYMCFFFVSYLIGFNDDDKELYYHIRQKICKKI